MSKDHVIEELSAYIDGEAKDPQRIARHLQHCEACARRHMELLRLAAHVQALSPPEVRPEFLTRVMAHVAEQEYAPSSRRFAFGGWRFALACATLVIGGLAGLAYHGLNRTESPDAAQTLVAESKIYDNEDVVVDRFEHLMDQGADLSYLEESATVYPDDGDPVPVDELFDVLADAAADDSYAEAGDGGDDIEDMLDSLDAQEAEALRDMLRQLLNAPDPSAENKG
jgi:hypothetical protein